MSQLPYVSVAPTEEQRKIARESELYEKGDMILIWVNEGDLYVAQVPEEDGDGENDV